MGGKLWKIACVSNFVNPTTTVHFFLNKSWWTVGSEGTTLTSGSIRVQRHHSKVTVRWGIFYLLTETSSIVKFYPTYRDLGVVSFDPLVTVMTFFPTEHQVRYWKKYGPLWATENHFFMVILFFEYTSPSRNSSLEHIPLHL